MEIFVTAIMLSLVAVMHCQPDTLLTAEQTECIGNETSARYEDVGQVCSEVFILCASGQACTNLFTEIFRNCGSDLLAANTAQEHLWLDGEFSAVCGFTARATIAAEVPNSNPLAPLNLTPQEEECISQELVREEVLATFFTGCSSIGSEDAFRDACNDENCLQTLATILGSCGITMDRIYIGCFGGPIGVTSSPIPDDDDVFDALGIPAPSDQQLLCIDVQAQARGADFVTACSDLIQGPDEEPTSGGIQEFCNDGDCRQLYEEVFGACDYNVLNILCAGSIKVNAVPLLVFVSVLLSICL